MDTLTRIALFAVLASAALAALAFGVRTRSSARQAAGANTSGRALSAEEIAYLLGGPARLAETVVAGLVAGGHLRVNREGLLTAITSAGPPAGAPGALGRLQAVASAAIGSGAVPAAGVLTTVARSAAATEIRDRLAARHLLLPPQAGRVRRLRAVAPLLGVSAATLVAAIGMDGGTRVPFGVLVAGTVLGALAVGAFPLPTRTLSGDAVVAAARQFSTTRGRSGTVVDLLDPPVLLGVAGLVAVGGFAAYPDQEVGDAMALARAKSDAVGNSSWGGCGGSSCGAGNGGGSSGGGCGGGAGGGCGGGGGG